MSWPFSCNYGLQGKLTPSWLQGQWWWSLFGLSQSQYSIQGKICDFSHILGIFHVLSPTKHEQRSMKLQLLWQPPYNIIKGRADRQKQFLGVITELLHQSNTKPGYCWLSIQYVSLFFKKTLLFRAVLDSQWNWEQATEISHTTLAPTHVQPPLLSASPPECYICYDWWNYIDPLLSPKVPSLH